MSDATESLRRRIAGANDLEGVVRSMKALAASTIGQYESAIKSLEFYWRTVELGLAACFRREVASDKGKAPAAVGATCAVVFGSGEGLVGQFNEVLADFAIRTLGRLPGKAKKVWAIGSRIHALLEGTDVTLGEVLSVPTSVDGIAPFVGQILVDIDGVEGRGAPLELYLFHNHPRSGATYEPVAKRLLPLDRKWQGDLTSRPWPTKSLPEVISGPTPAVLDFIREYLFISLFQACAESLASENQSRLAMMQRAEKNIQDTIQELNQRFHRIRQESIDEELFDVLSGYKAQS